MKDKVMKKIEIESRPPEVIKPERLKVIIIFGSFTFLGLNLLV